jgi:hypothetical protein
MGAIAEAIFEGSVSCACLRLFAQILLSAGIFQMRMTAISAVNTATEEIRAILPTLLEARLRAEALYTRNEFCSSSAMTLTLIVPRLGAEGASTPVPSSSATAPAHAPGGIPGGVPGAVPGESGAATSSVASTGAWKPVVPATVVAPAPAPAYPAASAAPPPAVAYPPVSSTRAAEPYVAAPAPSVSYEPPAQPAYGNGSSDFAL